eukprot:CAMPEP_0181032938 /NCGR_PEP_ID=MMETSP1070-20121207/6994_1 /TAXON_ID=265543 /ORGANISM="Minutocellus polymorphus, Strain NH13" /LENGTH=114 /DNA_ID=CAMNT_0023110339 /DNA_START=24 /DNA_END=368 /DNA_ORIENTATION=+
MVVAEVRAFIPTEASRGQSNPIRDELSISACAVTSSEMAIESGTVEIAVGREMNMSFMNRTRGATSSPALRPSRIERLPEYGTVGIMLPSFLHAVADPMIPSMSVVLKARVRGD